ncbi:hypothetical protein C8R44DRAFT_943848 [Mycena epipterygia]|nr:hypothetical protein C8R44DRAFT_943848 [Mycena epipterygia]
MADLSRGDELSQLFAERNKRSNEVTKVATTREVRNLSEPMPLRMSGGEEGHGEEEPGLGLEHGLERLSPLVLVCGLSPGVVRAHALHSLLAVLGREESRLADAVGETSEKSAEWAVGAIPDADPKRLLRTTVPRIWISPYGSEDGEEGETRRLEKTEQETACSQGSWYYTLDQQRGRPDAQATYVVLAAMPQRAMPQQLQITDMRMREGRRRGGSSGMASMLR